MRNECKYYRSGPNDQYVASCGVENGFPHIQVHPQDISGEFCQFCGRKIKRKENKEHPDLGN